MNFSSVDNLSFELKSVLSGICEHLHRFINTKEKSGEAWESCFAIVFLIRAATSRFVINKDFSLLDGASSRAYTVSFNEYIRDFSTYTTFEQLKSNVTRPERGKYPFIAIYSPGHSNFETYDLLAAVYEHENDEAKWYGYQLKEGRNLPQRGPIEGVRSFVIRGVSAQAHSCCRDWNVVSASAIREFLGLSGNEWGPWRWNEPSGVKVHQKEEET